MSRLSSKFTALTLFPPSFHITLIMQLHSSTISPLYPGEHTLTRSRNQTHPTRWLPRATRIRRLRFCLAQHEQPGRRLVQALRRPHLRSRRQNGQGVPRRRAHSRPDAESWYAATQSLHPNPDQANLNTISPCPPIYCPLHHSREICQLMAMI